MINTVILGDCLYKKAASFRRCKITAFQEYTQVPKTRIFAVLAAIRCSYLAMLSPLTRINTSLAILDMPLLPLQRTYVSGRGKVAVRSRF